MGAFNVVVPQAKWISDYMSSYGADAGGGGFMTKMGELFKNPLFLQYLSGAGNALASPHPAGASNLPSALDQVTQGMITNKNYWGMLKKVLGGEVPEGSSVKYDKSGMKLTIANPAAVAGGPTPPSALTSADEQPSAPAPTPAITPTPAATPAASPTTASTLLGFPNPFASGQLDFSTSDLAGLNPQLISQVLQLKMMQDKMGQERLKDVADIMYNQARLSQGERGLGLEEGRLGVDQQREARLFLEWANKDERPNLIQEFEYAKKHGYTGDISEFKSPETTTEWKNYLKVRENNPNYGKSFVEYQKELRSSGATRISVGEKVETAKALGGIKGQLYFKDPGWADDVNKYVKSEAVENSIYAAGAFGTPDAKKIELNEGIKYIKGKILAGGGKIEGFGPSPDGKAIVWTVRWESGDVEKITYAPR